MLGAAMVAGKDVRGSRPGDIQMLRMRTAGIAVLAAVMFVLPARTQQQNDAAASGAISATIDAAKVGEPISKYDYGMFIEHLGNLVNHLLWSEMVDDRKFYYPVLGADSPGPAERELGGGRKKWRPVGPQESVTMDKDHPYTGDHSPQIALDAAPPHGLAQSGLALIKGKAYAGRVVLAGTAGARVKVSLVWGPNDADRQTIAIPALHSDYAKFPVKFTAQADTPDGRLEIVGTGSGSFHVGAVSLMPTDNVHGFRRDTTALLRELNSGFYRWPGGNFISGYDWRDGIGDPDRRPPTWDYAWKVMQPNDVGMDEFMEMCKLLNVEPYITVNAGLGDDHSAAEQVEYMNGSVHTRLGALRAANGHPEPYHVHYWNVGNEPYGYWQIGYTSLRYYEMKHNAFAKAMRRVDPSIVILAAGATPDEMTVTTNARLLTGKVQAEFGGEADWTGGLLDKSLDYFDALTEHWYARGGKRFDLELHKDDILFKGDNAGYVPVEEPLEDWARRPSNRVREKVEAWQEYQKRFPAMVDRKIFLSIDEWAYSGERPDLRLALSYAEVFHEMFRHTDIIKMAAFTFGTSCLDIDSTHAQFNTNGLLFKLYREHFGTLPVEVSGNSPMPGPKWPVGGDQPKVNAGSPTYPLDVMAALTSDRKFLTIAVVNPTESVRQLTLNIGGVEAGGKSRMWLMTGPKTDSGNVLGKPTEVSVLEMPLADLPKKVSIAPISINIYEVPVH
jgi:alpha-N-arabinofuranosidase